jgi:hypothetical protein
MKKNDVIIPHELTFLAALKWKAAVITKPILISALQQKIIELIG